MPKLLSAGSIFFFMLAHVKAMAMPEPLYLFSEVTGVVTIDGKPVAGAEVQQIYIWKSDEVINRTLTDEEGRYSFPEVTKTSFIWSWLPHEPFISQRVNILQAGETHKGWFYSKHDYDKNGELKGRPINLRCDLINPTKAHPETEYFGLCTLDFRKK